MRKTISWLFLVAAAATGSGQTLTFRQTDFQFFSLKRAEKVAYDIGRIQPEPDTKVERESAPEGRKFVVVRFALPYSPSENPHKEEASLVGAIEGKPEPQTFKCVSTYLWVPVNGTWWAAFVFVVPDEASLLSFRLGKDQEMSSTEMPQSAALPKQ